MARKQHAAKQGIVASDNLDTVFQREIFFAVDPSTLDFLDAEEVKEDWALPSFFLDLDFRPLMKYLPELEAEIFWLIYEKKKHQKDIAKLLGLSQPTISYRYRRTITKLRYLMTIVDLPLRDMLRDMTFLKTHEQDILFDLFFFLNQELVGQKHNVRQSTVKWIFTKTKKQLEALEQKEPERWYKHLGMMILLDQFFLIRVLH